MSLESKEAEAEAEAEAPAQPQNAQTRELGESDITKMLIKASDQSAEKLSENTQQRKEISLIIKSITEVITGFGFFESSSHAAKSRDFIRKLKKILVRSCNENNTLPNIEKEIAEAIDGFIARKNDSTGTGKRTWGLIQKHLSSFIPVELSSEQKLYFLDLIADGQIEDVKGLLQYKRYRQSMPVPPSYAAARHGMPVPPSYAAARYIKDEEKLKNMIVLLSPHFDLFDDGFRFIKSRCGMESFATALKLVVKNPFWDVVSTIIRLDLDKTKNKPDSKKYAFALEEAINAGQKDVLDTFKFSLTLKGCLDHLEIATSGPWYKLDFLRIKELLNQLSRCAQTDDYPFSTARINESFYEAIKKGLPHIAALFLRAGFGPKKQGDSLHRKISSSCVHAQIFEAAKTLADEKNTDEKLDAIVKRVNSVNAVIIGFNTRRAQVFTYQSQKSTDLIDQLQGLLGCFMRDGNSEIFVEDVNKLLCQYRQNLGGRKSDTWKTIEKEFPCLPGSEKSESPAKLASSFGMFSPSKGKGSTGCHVGKSERFAIQ
jgi:hypothetical protein